MSRRPNLGDAEPTPDQPPQELYLSHLGLLADVVRYVAQRHRLRDDEAEELEALARLRLLENDYAVLRSWRGESRLSTFLTTVVLRWQTDLQRRRGGRWRPSATARRLGLVAEELERLLHRDGLSFGEASRVIVLSRKRQVTQEQLESLAAELPPREMPPPPEEAPLDPAGELVAEEEERRGQEVLAAVVRELSAEDRLLVRLRFHHDLPVPLIAGQLGEKPSAVYGRLRRLLARLRREMVAAGFSRSDALRLLARPSALRVDWEEPARSTARVRPKA